MPTILALEDILTVGIQVTASTPPDAEDLRPRLKKSERCQQILLELKLHPHVRISDLAERFGVSTETVRRDMDRLSRDGLIARAHGGASAAGRGQYPSLDERTAARIPERERIGRRAAAIVAPGETLMIDSGSTTIQFARALAYLGTPCTVITNSIPVAMTLAQEAVQVLLAPGEYQATESAVVGTETLEYLSRFRVDRCFIGALGLTAEGPFETVRGFAAIKRAMLERSDAAHLLIDAQKYGRSGLARVGTLDEVSSVVVDERPPCDLSSALSAAGVEVMLAS